ncbi:right-handed parallel beta-helix repeat-containing protein [Sporomusa sp.]|uniref:right-handed parallel beta-helix repeat-containing protein n=1 Tax=Sporomusa sp. TaxID=2078658 RepID=UPI002C7E7758|nr:right-handed parallel beta-helix repeat-containing protein [Sporomusa sp.]HWR42970.1 right-handed parallel beta-helix repeat-containing protein [Sporomusa sp.]
MSSSIKVMSDDDSGSGSLRDAISTAVSGDTIIFDPAIDTIKLTSGQIKIDKNLTINGPGADKLRVSGDKKSRVFEISGGVEVTIKGISIMNGFTLDEGGAIRNNGILTITDSTIFDNRADHGGAMYNNGTIIITNSTISDNTWIYLGGAIFNNNGTITITNSTISDNRAADGGAIANYDTITIRNSTLYNNRADTVGGAITNDGIITITDSMLSNNHADGGGVLSIT